MSSISVTEARSQLPELINRARGEAVFLERRGNLAAVLISPEQYAKMTAALEDAEDAQAFDAAMGDEGENIPWAQAKADLGWEWVNTRSSFVPQLSRPCGTLINKTVVAFTGPSHF